MSDKTPAELAESYLNALESRADDGEYEDVLENRDALQERLERFKENYGESDPATQELQEKVEAAEGRAAEIEKELREPEEAKHELLDAATGFMLNDEWLKPEVIKALNRALTGEASEALLVEEIELRNVGDAEALEDVNRYDVIDVMSKIVMDKLGESEDLMDVWRSIQGSTKEGPFRAVAKMGRADTKAVAEALDEDVDLGTVNNRLKNAVHHLEITPYHREDGTYRLSTAGKYIASEYAGVVGSDEMMEHSKEEPPQHGDDGQTTLLNGTTAADGGDDNE